MTTQMSLKTVPDDKLALGVWFSGSRLLLSIASCFCSPDMPTVLYKAEKVLLFSPPPPPKKNKREKGDNSEFIDPALRLDAARTRLAASESWAPWTPRATQSLWKSNLTSSLVWHCKTKRPNQRVLFSISVTSRVLGSKYETNAATIPISRPLEK